jgi:hypothetical protein
MPLWTDGPDTDGRNISPERKQVGINRRSYLQGSDKVDLRNDLNTQGYRILASEDFAEVGYHC